MGNAGFTLPACMASKILDLCYIGSKPQRGKKKFFFLKKEFPTATICHYLWIHHLILYLIGCNEPGNGQHSLSLSFSLKSSFLGIEILVVLHKRVTIKPSQGWKATTSWRKLIIPELKILSIAQGSLLCGFWMLEGQLLTRKAHSQIE